MVGVVITNKGRGGDQEFEQVLQSLVNEGVETGVRVQSELGEELHTPYLHQSARSCVVLCSSKYIFFAST